MILQKVTLRMPKTWPRGLHLDAVVCAGANNDQLVAKVNQSYPGRASMAPSLDLLITLLHWGASGWTKILQDRERLLPEMQAALSRFAEVSAPPVAVLHGLSTLWEAKAPEHKRSPSDAPAA